jgi:hypothetical protein
MGRTTAPTRKSTNHTSKKKKNKEGVVEGGKHILIYFSRTR